MPSVDRRAFLAAAASLGMPAWLVNAFAQDPATPADEGDYARLADLRAAWARAQERGKPLLVLAVPEDAREAWPRGLVLGALFHHGGDQTLLDLALCEVACATRAETEQVTGKSAPATGDRRRRIDPLLILVEAGADRSLLPIPDPDLQLVVTESLQRSIRRPPEQRVLARLADLAAAVHEAIAKDVGSVAARADRNRATLTDSERTTLDRFFAGDPGPAPDAELLVRAAAVVCMAAEAPRRPDDRARLLAEVIAATRTRYVQAPPSGARWAVATGCGARIEGPRLGGALGISGPCGTGFVPALGRRFLYFLTRDQR